jgi:hypothetical protein
LPLKEDFRQLPGQVNRPGLPDYMKIRNIPQCKLLIQAKQSKSSQGTEQLKAPEIVKQTLVCNFKTKQKETDINS